MVAERDDDLERLYAARRDFLLGAATTITGSAEEAKDIVQEAFARLFENRATLRNPEAVINTIVAHLSIDFHRRRQSEARKIERETRNLKDSLTSPDYSYVLDILDDLPEGEREVILLTVVLGLEVKQVADILRRPAAEISRQKYRGLRQLKDRWSE
jgi:RNA polymerase sigma-70 factor (ECF subfamily)